MFKEGLIEWKSGVLSRNHVSFNYQAKWEREECNMLKQKGYWCVKYVC